MVAASGGTQPPLKSHLPTPAAAVAMMVMPSVCRAVAVTIIPAANAYMCARANTTYVNTDADISARWGRRGRN